MKRNFNIQIFIDKNLRIGHESVFVKVRQNNTDILIAGLYISPTAHEDTYVSAIQCIESVIANIKTDKIITIGDFNLTHLNWTYHDNILELDTSNPGAAASNRRSATILRDFFSELNMQQHHPKYPEKGYTLDLAFANTNLLKYLHSSDFMVDADSDHHYSATFSVQGNIQFSEDVHLSRYNFKKGDYKEISKLLSLVSWNSVLDIKNDINYCVNKFYETLYEIISVTVPKFQFKCKNFPPWFSIELIQCIIQKKNTFKMEDVRV